jgi:3-deoxy-D-manno-octulosonic-acid transferase
MRIISRDVSRAPGPATGRAMLGVYRSLTWGLYAVLRLGHALLPPMRSRLGPRLGLDGGAARPGDMRAGPLIHFHAASVGEISSLAPVVTELRRRAPGYAVMITTMTRTGARRAAEAVPGARVGLLPFDLAPAIRRFLGVARPEVLVIAETELWPNLLEEAVRLGTRAVLVNGRVSSRTIGHYSRLRPLMASVLSDFDLLLMRSEEDAARLLSLGADPADVEVAGNTKYDMLPGRAPLVEREKGRADLGIEPGRPVVMLGSAREGESEILLGALEAAGRGQAPAVIIAPRHLEVVARVEAACRRYGYGVVLSAAGGSIPAGSPGSVIIVNEMGRLLHFYALADIAVLGGTFAPRGGHNPLEPASQGAVVVAGPYRDNIKDDMQYLLSADAAVVTDEAGLAAAIGSLLAEPGRVEAMAGRASSAVLARKGAAVRCVDAMMARGIIT